MGIEKGIVAGKKMLIEKLSQILQSRHVPIHDMSELITLLAEELEPKNNTTNVEEVKKVEVLELETFT